MRRKEHGKDGFDKNIKQNQEVFKIFENIKETKGLHLKNMSKKLKKKKSKTKENKPACQNTKKLIFPKQSKDDRRAGNVAVKPVRQAGNKKTMDFNCRQAGEFFNDCKNHGKCRLAGKKADGALKIPGFRLQKKMAMRTMKKQVAQAEGKSQRQGQRRRASRR